MKFCNRGHCTCFFDKVWKWILTPCCKLHDFNYKKQHIRRVVADRRFYKCLSKHSPFLLAGMMWFAVRTFGWHFWNKEKRKNMGNKKSNAILDHDEMMAWYNDPENHYLGEIEDNIFHITPFVCDFEVVQDGNVLLRGVAGQGLGYDMIARKLLITGGN